MKIIQLKTTEKHQDLHEFVKTLNRTDSKFEYDLTFQHEVIISLKPRIFSILRSHSSHAVNLVSGIVDERALDTLEPIIEIRPSFLYQVFRWGGVGELFFMCSASLFTLDWIFILGTALMTLLFLGIIHMFYKFGEEVFEDLLHQELARIEKNPPSERPNRRTDTMILEDIRRMKK